MTNELSNIAIDEREAARYLGISHRVLQSWRVKGKGPRFIRYSRRAVRYTLRALDEFREALVAGSTAEYEDPRFQNPANPVTTAPVAANANQADVPAQPVRRGRGRPRKNIVSGTRGINKTRES